MSIDSLLIKVLEEDNTKLQAENKAQTEMLSQKDATIRTLTKRHKLDVSENKELRASLERISLWEQYENMYTTSKSPQEIAQQALKGA